MLGRQYHFPGLLLMKGHLMKLTIFFAIITFTLAYNIGATPVAETPPCINTVPPNLECVSYSDALQLTHAQGNQLGLCKLPAGWNWVKEYEISYDEPQPWHWLAWPNDTTVKICR